MKRPGWSRRGSGGGRKNAADEEESDPDGSARRVLAIVNSRGLHARAAARFVKVAGSFDAEIKVRRNDMTVSGLSIMGLMMLAAAPGTEIEVIAAGSDAEAAVEALAELVADKFGEE